MANLYQINADIMACIDSDTGEVIDPEKLNALFMERDAKIEGVALWIKNLTADVAAYKSEIDAFTERKKQAEAKIEGLKRWLSDALEGQKFSTAKCAVSFRKSTQVYIPDETIVPNEYRKETIIYKTDKVAIKEAIKAGKEVDGCSLVENLNISIK